VTDQTDTNADIWKSEAIAKSFAAQSAQRERERAEQLTFVARLLPFKPDEAFTFIDLGAGTGAAARAVLAEYPAATGILAEYSPQMTAEGRRQLTDYEGRYRYVEFDMLDATWPNDVPLLDAAISALSVHHLPDARKAALFAEIRAHLRTDGWYVNYDPVSAPDDALERIWERVNDRYDTNGPFKRAHRTPEEQARFENHVRYIIPLQPQLDWLRAAGFVDVDVYWKRLDWVIYGGRNPG
jgi:tRNA (cmo5U34)-methyltransferase